MNDRYMVVTNMTGTGDTSRLFFNERQLWKAKKEAKEHRGHVYDLRLRARVA